VGHVAWMGHMENVNKILVRKSEGKRPIGRLLHNWEDNIRIHRRETGWEGVEWIYVAQDKDQWRALVNTVMNPQVP